MNVTTGVGCSESEVKEDMVMPRGSGEAAVGEDNGEGELWSVE